MKGVRIGCAMTGSFCTFEKAFAAWRALGETGAELVPIMSENAYTLNTRFYSAEDARFRKSPTESWIHRWRWR